MKEFFEFLQTIGERLRSRVFGPFIISFLFWNWKPILLILASKCSIEDTIGLIESESMFSFSNVILYPFLISISYSIVVPFISLGLGLLIIWPQSKSIQSNYILKGEKRKEDVKIAKLDFEYENAKAGKLELQELNNKVSSLNKEKENHLSEIESLNYQLENVKQDILIQAENLKRDYDLNQENIVNKWSDKYLNDIGLAQGFFLEDVNKELQKGDFLLRGLSDKKINYLKDEKLIIFIIEDGIELGYTFTDKGRKAYINFIQRTRNNLS